MYKCPQSHASVPSDKEFIALHVPYTVHVTSCCCPPSHPRWCCCAPPPPRPLLADITRLERWERAAKYGKSPPDQIRELILKHPDNKEVSERYVATTSEQDWSCVCRMNVYVCVLCVCYCVVCAYMHACVCVLVCVCVSVH